MKRTFLFLYLLGLTACHQSKKEIKKDTVSNKEGNETLKNHDLENCGFENILQSKKVSVLAKKIYTDADWNLDNEQEALALLDSLSAHEKSLRPFYFKVLSKAAKKSDGYFAEGLGLAGYEFVLNHTEEFASYFDHPACHTEKDLDTWTELVMLEFKIIGEEEDNDTIVENYINKLKINCKKCSASQQKTMDKFSLMLLDKWNDFLQNKN